MDLPSYTSYKDCEVEFFATIPSHWTVWKVTHGFELIGSGTTPKSSNPAFYDGDTPWITTSELRENIVNESKHMVSEQALKEYSTLKVYEPGALAIAMYGATIGRLGILGVSATVNQACCVFDKPEQFNIKFFFYWLWMHRPTLISLSVGGGQPNLSQDDLKQLRVPAPPIPEQTQIAKFLDYKTAQIDRLIEKKKALIEKLNEQRIAMITQAVTKGLNPDAPMKDSEVGWLGEVPEHWEIKPLKFSFNNLNNRRIPLSAEERTGMPKNYRYYGASGVIDMVENYIFDEPTVLIGEDGANLLSRSTPLAFEATGKYWVNNHAHILSPIEGPFSYWSNLLCIVQYDPWITGSAQPKLTKDNLGSILLPRPPVEEQHSIADFVNKTASKIDPMIDLAETTIEKLNEYRTALITAAVTGKIDVREVEIPKQGAA